MAAHAPIPPPSSSVQVATSSWPSFFSSELRAALDYGFGAPLSTRLSGYANWLKGHVYRSPAVVASFAFTGVGLALAVHGTWRAVNSYYADIEAGRPDYLNFRYETNLMLMPAAQHLTKEIEAARAARLQHQKQFHEYLRQQQSTQQDK